MPANKTPVRTTTQNHLDISDIQDNLVLLKNNSCCLILKTTAINFGLLSEREQDATIYAYAGFLNSLTFPVQILINSRQKDISSYLGIVDQFLKTQQNEKIKSFLQDYRKFIENIVQKNKILDKKFYVVIPFISISKASQKALLEKAKTELHPKRDHLISQFQRLGLKAIQLNNQEIIELFYGIYNTSGAGQKFASPGEYTTPFVRSSMNPTALAQTPPPAHQQISQIPTVPASTTILSSPQKPETTPLKSIPSTPVSAPDYQQTPITPMADLKTSNSHYSPNAIKPNNITVKQSSQHLEGKDLQDKINTIVKKVIDQAPIIKPTTQPQNQQPVKKMP